MRKLVILSQLRDRILASQGSGCTLRNAASLVPAALKNDKVSSHSTQSHSPQLLPDIAVLAANQHATEAASQRSDKFRRPGISGIDDFLCASRAGLHSLATTTADGNRHAFGSISMRQQALWPPRGASLDGVFDLSRGPGCTLRFASSQAARVGISRAGPLAEYRYRVSQGTLKQGDDHQVETIKLLQDLYEAIIGVGGESPFKFKPAPSGFWSRLLPRQKKEYTRGLYLWGGVGTGKTMLMDLFYEELPSWMLCTRIHFHDFMLSTHSRLQKHRGLQDPLSQVAAEQAEETRILCLDEFMVTDVADAMILNRLFTSLFEHGVILIATSNRPPSNLYENGLQRDLFLPFIALLEQRCIVHEIGSCTDYRKLTKVQQGKYFIGHDGDELLAEKVKLLTKGHTLEPCTVDVVMGRKLKVPRSAPGVAWFHFQELCEMPLGAADFFALCKNFHTVAVDGVPVFGAATRSAAYRFVTFIDVMYESKTGLIISAEGPPLDLFEKVKTIANAPRRSKRPSSSRSEEADLLVDDELGFAKDRTMSRLIEMQSSEYERQMKISHEISL